MKAITEGCDSDNGVPPIVSRLKDHIELCLNEISSEGANEFQLGEIYAYVECLELLMQCVGATAEQLLEIEDRYGVTEIGCCSGQKI